MRGWERAGALSGAGLFVFDRQKLEGKDASRILTAEDAEESRGERREGLGSKGGRDWSLDFGSAGRWV